MKYRVVCAAFAAIGMMTCEAAAASLPAIKTSGSNKVPVCATPGRLMAFAQSRNSRIGEKFDGTATEYMRHGEALKIRWDYAFFQMLVETGNLTFVGDVNPSQYNFAGLGATGGGNPGERFANLSAGVKAHLQHVLMYTGEHIDDPVAERTRKVQEWNVLTKWQKSIEGPMTFAHLTRQWSPKDRQYSKDIGSVADSFYEKFCDKPDPRPELVAEARGKDGVSVDTAGAVDKDSKGKKIAARAIEDSRKSTGPNRLGLGAGSVGATIPKDDAATAAPSAGFTILNGSTTAADDSTANADKAESSGEKKIASAAGAAASAASSQEAAKETASDAATAAAACRVWQASYGGQKAVIIQAIDNGQTNYTVLDVNEGREQREVAAYIAAYAKNGKSVGEFASSNKALTKAFELCPEG